MAYILSPYFDEIPLAAAASIGIEETRDLVNEAEFKRDWNGNIIVIQPPFAPKAKITLRASGKAIQKEATFDGLMIGQFLTLHSRKSSLAFIDIGNYGTSLRWNCVTGSPSQPAKGWLEKSGTPVALDMSEALFANLAVAAVQPERVIVSYYPKILCLVKKWSGIAQTSDGTESWTLDLEEW